MAVVRKCKHCGNPVVHPDRKTAYCSKDCKHEGRNDNRREAEAERLRRMGSDQDSVADSTDSEAEDAV